MKEQDYFAWEGTDPSGERTWFYDNELYASEARFAVFIDTTYPNLHKSGFDGGIIDCVEVVVIKRVYGEPADFLAYCREGKVPVDHFDDLEIASNAAKLLALEKCMQIELRLK